MEEKGYTADGYLVVSEVDTCALWEKDSIPCKDGCAMHCFFCKFSNFRTLDYIKNIERKTPYSKLYSVCQNENNRKN